MVRPTDNGGAVTTATATAGPSVSAAEMLLRMEVAARRVAQARDLAATRVLPSSLAFRKEVECVVEPAHPGRRKRRKAWRVSRREVERPAAFVVGNTLFVHPLAYSTLKSSTLPNRDPAA